MSTLDHIWFYVNEVIQDGAWSPQSNQAIRGLGLCASLTSGGRREAGAWIYLRGPWFNQSCLWNKTPTKTLNTKARWNFDFLVGEHIYVLESDVPSFHEERAWKLSAQDSTPHLCASSFDWYWFVPIYNKIVIVSVVLFIVLWVLANQTSGVVGTSEFIAHWSEMWEAQGPPKCSWYLKHWGPCLNCGVWCYSWWLVSELYWSTLVSVRMVLYFYYNST